MLTSNDLSFDNISEIRWFLKRNRDYLHTNRLKSLPDIFARIERAVDYRKNNPSLCNIQWLKKLNINDILDYGELFLCDIYCGELWVCELTKRKYYHQKRGSWMPVIAHNKVLTNSEDLIRWRNGYFRMPPIFEEN